MTTPTSATNMHPSPDQITESKYNYSNEPNTVVVVDNSVTNYGPFAAEKHIEGNDNLMNKSSALESDISNETSKPFSTLNINQISYKNSISGNLLFTWEDVGYAIAIPKSKTSEIKNILIKNSGSVRSGQVVAILGGSGAGKSTLLNTLSGRLGSGILLGKILLNNKPRNPDNWQEICAFVEQDDLMFKNLTVHETLLFSAKLRLSKDITLSEKLERVEKIIYSLGLVSCRDTKVGDHLRKGISGGERKRLAIGIELIAEPKVLFLDEPTSGLDAFTSLNIIRTIKQIAVEKNIIVLLTIHQPRTDILSSFDNIILLSIGKTVWNGSMTDALSHFENLGYKIPPLINPSDFLMDITVLDQRSDKLLQDSKERIDLFSEAWNKKLAINENFSKDLADVSNIKWSNRITPAEEIVILSSRNLLNIYREPSPIIAGVFSTAVIVGLIAILFSNLSLDQIGIDNRLGAFFFLILNQTFSLVLPNITSFVADKAIIKRERASKSYHSTSAYIARFFSTLPQIIINVFILTFPVYWIMGLQYSISKFFTFVCIISVHASTSLGYGLFIGSFIPNIQVGQIIAPLSLIIFLLFSGLLASISRIPEGLRWIQYISFLAYSNKALNQNELLGLIFHTCVKIGRNDKNCTPAIVTGENVIEMHSYGDVDLWNCVAINFCILIILSVLGCFFFNKSSAPLMRLK